MAPGGRRGAVGAGPCQAALQEVGANRASPAELGNASEIVGRDCVIPELDGS